MRDSSNSLPRDSSNSLPRDVPPFVHEASLTLETFGKTLQHAAEPVECAGDDLLGAIVEHGENARLPRPAIYCRSLTSAACTSSTDSSLYSRRRSITRRTARARGRGSYTVTTRRRPARTIVRNQDTRRRAATWQTHFVMTTVTLVSTRRCFSHAALMSAAGPNRHAMCFERSTTLV